MANIYNIFFTIVNDISKECFKYNLKPPNFINKQEYESLYKQSYVLLIHTRSAGVS